MMNISSMVKYIYVDESTNETIIYLLVTSYQDNGILVQFSTNTKMMNISSMSNEYDGIRIEQSTNTTMMNISSMYDQYGIHIHVSTNTTMMNVSSFRNGNNGIFIDYSINTTMINLSSTWSQYSGMIIVDSTNTTMINILSMNNKLDGIYIENCTNTKMIDTSLLLITYHTSSVTIPNAIISLKSCSDVHIKNISILVDKNINIGQNAVSFFGCKDNILLEESIFSDIKSDLQQVINTVANLPAIITLYDTTLILKNCNFTSNMITSIAATSSNITVEEKIMFESNSAISGTAFILTRSLLIISEQSNVVFQNNSASQYGAVFYIVTEQVPETSILISDLIHSSTHSFITSGTQCFIQVKETTARLTFINNTAVEGGDVVYGGQIAAGYDGDWNCLLSFKNISNMTYQPSIRKITSAPSRVCLCHDTSPDCLIVVDPTSHTIYPGETLTVSAAVVGQDFGTVSGDVHAQFGNYSKCYAAVHNDQKRMSYENGACKNFNYKIYSNCKEYGAQLVLTSEEEKDFRIACY